MIQVFFSVVNNALNLNKSDYRWRNLRTIRCDLRRYANGIRHKEKILKYKAQNIFKRFLFEIILSLNFEILLFTK